MTDYRSREKLIGVTEHRSFSANLECRENSDGHLILEGYAATYDPYDVHGGPAGGGWVEELSVTAFDNTLASQPDVQLLVNHEGLPLARTTSGNLKLSRDRHGLRVWASLDPSDPDVQRLAPKLKPQANGRSIMDEMSFAFRVKDQTWDNSYTHRTIQDLTLEKGDVSVVNYGMNPGTRAVLSSEAVGALAQLSNKELVELRKLDRRQIQRAQAALAAVYRDKSPSKPYGDVPYADPGYKADGKKRYPIDTEAHARAAWSYINMPKNQKGYSSSQVAAIKSRIKGALKKFGVKVSEDKTAAGLSHIDMVQCADGNTSLVAVMSDGTRVPLPSQRKVPPGDMPQPDSHNQPEFGTDFPTWNPSDPPDDPHEEGFDEGEIGSVDETAPPWHLGPVPDNIKSGTVNFDHPAFHDPGESPDPHSIPYEELKKLMPGYTSRSEDPHDQPRESAVIGGGSKVTPDYPSGTPHSTPYSVGTQVGSVPGDRPNLDITPTVKPADEEGPEDPHLPLPKELLGAGLYDWTGTPIEDPLDPDQDLDAPADRPGIGTRDITVCPGGDACPGDSCPDHGHDVAYHGVDPDMDMDCKSYNPETGEGRVRRNGDGDDTEPDDDPDDRGSNGDSNGDADEDDVGKNAFNLSIAEALDRTIVHAYQLAQGNTDLRKVLATAWRQLATMRGIRAPKNTDVSRKLNELRKEIGLPDTGTVSDGLAYLRSMGSAPVGYRGALSGDPDCHAASGAELVAREASAKARTANAEAAKAESRLKAVRREAELNAVIARSRKAG